MEENKTKEKTNKAICGCFSGSASIKVAKLGKEEEEEEDASTKSTNQVIKLGAALVPVILT